MSALHAGEWLWLAWYVTWWIPALWSPKATARPARGGDNRDRLMAGVGAMLLFFTPGLGPHRFWLFSALWAEPPAVGWSLFAFIVAGFAFCWWARAHLGRLWSGLVTAKADHHVVRSGPYALVRHPIYTGVIVSAAAVALIKASPSALLGAAMMTVGFGMTARKEEGFLGQQLGVATYDDYRRATPMLVPFLRTRSRASQAT